MQMTSDFERVDLDDHWITKWKKSEVPVYVVLVVVPASKIDWVDYRDEDTLHDTRAYWARYCHSPRLWDHRFARG